LPAGLPIRQGTIVDMSSPDLSGHLLTILSNPPLTSGARTLARVELARHVLGYETVSVANIFAVETHRSGGISEIGAGSDGWEAAQRLLAPAINSADAVLFAYGRKEPSGPARFHFRAQLVWVRNLVESRALPIWDVDGQPRHPSRWQRHTYSKYPLLQFQEALPLVLTRVPSGREG